MTQTFEPYLNLLLFCSGNFVPKMMKIYSLYKTEDTVIAQPESVFIRTHFQTLTIMNFGASLITTGHTGQPMKVTPTYTLTLIMNTFKNAKLIMLFFAIP